MIKLYIKISGGMTFLDIYLAYGYEFASKNFDLNPRTMNNSADRFLCKIQNGLCARASL